LVINGRPAIIVTGRADREYTLDCRQGYSAFLYIRNGVGSLSAYGCAAAATDIPVIQAIFRSVVL
jgi:hypothetical protein